MKLRYRIGGGLLVFFAVAAAFLALVLSYDAPCEPPSRVADGRGTMQAVTFGCYGSPEVLEIGAVEKPVPAPDQVLVRVRAAGVNPLDWHFVRGSPYFIRLMSGIGRPSNTPRRDGREARSSSTSSNASRVALAEYRH